MSSCLLMHKRNHIFLIWPSTPCLKSSKEEMRAAASYLWIRSSRLRPRSSSCSSCFCRASASSVDIPCRSHRSRMALDWRRKQSLSHVFWGCCSSRSEWCRFWWTGNQSFLLHLYHHTLPTLLLSSSAWGIFRRYLNGPSWRLLLAMVNNTHVTVKTPGEALRVLEGVVTDRWADRTHGERAFCVE